MRLPPRPRRLTHRRILTFRLYTPTVITVRTALYGKSVCMRHVSGLDPIPFAFVATLTALPSERDHDRGDAALLGRADAINLFEVEAGLRDLQDSSARHIGRLRCGDGW